MKKLKIILQSKIFYVILGLIILLNIFIRTIFIKYESNLNNVNKLTGTIIDINISEDKISFLLKNEELVMCNYYIKEFNKDYKKLLGKKVIVNGNILNIYNNTIPNNFNYKNYLYNKRIYTLFNVSKIEILEEENVLYKIKNKIISRIDKFDNKLKIYLNLFILGDKTYLDSDNYNNYKINGIWHLFAISGMHIGLIILILNKILIRFKYKNSIVSLFLLYFAFLTSFSASVLRATIFFYLKNILNFLKIKIDNKKILFLTAFLILLNDPFTIYNTGFQYSFLITYAIMHESDKITGNYFMKILKISIISFIVSLPITINMNFEINILSIFLNIIYVPFISLVVFPLSILTFIFPFLSFILNFFIIILEYSNYIFELIKFSVIIPKMSILLIAIYYFILYLYSKIRNNCLFVCLLIIILFNITISKIDSNYHIYYLDVNQGDSSLLISPYKSTVIMIDTGGLLFSDYHISSNVILFLKSFGINKIDSLIITHGDYDHMGEAINLVNNFKVEKLIFNCGEFNDLEKELIKVLDKKKIPYYSCIKKLNIDDNKIYFLNNELYDNENDNSSVIYTELNNHKFLFMGDAGIEVEEDLIEKYDLQDIDILKVGHHGSKTSTSEKFIDSINPKYSIISVGKNNRYGHPNKEVLNVLEDSKIYRTDIDGSIMFKINKYKLKIETCTP